MANRTCYLFAIGGTGARIIESLTFLLASGSCWYGINERSKESNVEPGLNLRDWQFVPIIIDLDKSNGNLQSCITALDKYRSVSNTLNPADGTQLASNYFRYPILTLKEKSKSNKLADNSFLISGNIDTSKTLKDLIDYTTLPNGADKLMDLLFTEDDKNLKLEKGFKGNPHIGAVFFEQFEKEGLIDIIRKDCNFNRETDRIFVISSIFGGTGAAGFPWLAKTLRKTNTDEKTLMDAKIGALSILPYFTLHGGQVDSKIDSNSFITKTKSALKYYSKNIGNHLNSIYYVGDSETPQQLENYEGGLEQNNPASTVELIGASAILHFLQVPDVELSGFTNGMPNSVNHLAYGIETSEGTKNILFWDDLKHNVTDQQKSREKFFIPLLYFHISCLMVNKMIKDINTINWATKTDIIKINKKNLLSRLEYDRQFFSSNFYTELSAFMGLFNNWLKDLHGHEKKNNLKYQPFEIDPEITAPDFNNFMNSIIINSNLTDGVNVVNKVKTQGRNTTYYYSLKPVFYKQLVNLLNKPDIIDKTKALKGKSNDSTLAIRLMNYIYTVPFELINDSATKTILK